MMKLRADLDRIVDGLNDQVARFSVLEARSFLGNAIRSMEVRDGEPYSYTRLRTPTSGVTPSGEPNPGRRAEE
jgi:hypothetical protein